MGDGRGKSFQNVIDVIGSVDIQGSINDRMEPSSEMGSYTSTKQKEEVAK
jgi:hypothetical protein